jgi:COX assembly protein 2
MHPPLYKAHPLCQPEVEELVRCHAEKPVQKFFGACNDAKHWLDTCFREEKKMRKSLNPRVSGAEWVKAMPGQLVAPPAGAEGAAAAAAK